VTTSADGYQTRIVTVGTDDLGRSYVTSDAPGAVRFPSPILVSTAVWEAADLPVRIGADHTPDQSRWLPPSGGFRVFLSAFAPNKTWDSDPDQTAAALNAAGLNPGAPGRAPGFHTTPTVDIVAVISGEIYVMLDDGEVLLHPGDCLIQNGTSHAWDNRADHDATVLCIMVDAH